MLDYCDVITVPSKCLADSMPDHLAQLRGMWTVGKLRIIPHGVNVNPVVAIRRPSDKLRVGWFGAGSAKKGFGTFCDVARALKDSGVEFSVHAPLDPEVNLEGLEHVTFHGPFEHGALGTWLQTVDVAVVAAMRNETYGSVVDEVVAYGCPVLVANVPAIAERYANNSTSPIFPYDWGDADKLGTWITTFAEHPERLPKREARALKSFEANALDYLKIYRELAP
jgi:glycosyltransferase involved in cell wall biosynthesis